MNKEHPMWVNAPKGRIEGQQRTWLDPEELAYPTGSLAQSRRKCVALCADDVVRMCVVGIPDTMFSIPARTKIDGKSVSGYVYTYNETFRFQAQGEHTALSDWSPKVAE